MVILSARASLCAGIAALALAFSACVADDEPEDRLAPAQEAELARLVRTVPFTRGAERKQALDMIAAHGRFAIPEIEEHLLTSEDHAVRANGVYALGVIFDEYREPRALELIRQAADDRSQDVRLEAARVLLQGGDPRGVADLLAALDDSNPLVRRNAFEALRGAIGRDYGYDPAAAPEARREAVNRFRDHFARTGG